MPIRVICPHCEAKVTVKSPTAPGKRVRCPECDEQFAPTDDADFEERSRSRSRGRDDNDERTSRRRASRDDRDDRPSRRRSTSSSRNRKKKTSPLVFILPAAGLAAAAVVGTVLYLTVVKGSGESKKSVEGTPHELFAHLPDDAFTVHYVEVDKILNYPGLPDRVRQDLRSNGAKRFRGIPAEDVETYTHGSSDFPAEATVLKLKVRPIDEQRIVALTQGQPTTKDGQPYYRTPRGGLMHFPGVGLVRFVPDWPKTAGRSDLSRRVFPALHAKVKGQVWSLDSTGPNLTVPVDGGHVRAQYIVTQINLLPDSVEHIQEWECLNPADAVRLAATREKARNLPGERDSQIAQNGSTVTIRKLWPVESSENLFASVFAAIFR